MSASFPPLSGSLHPRSKSCVCPCVNAPSACRSDPEEPRLPRHSSRASSRVSPSVSEPVAARVRPFVTDPVAPATPSLPALNGRSVRNLRHVRTVRAMRRNVAIVAVGFAAVLVGGVALPAYAQAAAPPAYAAPKLQSLAVSAALPLPIISRDAYSMTVPPALQWPVDPGSPIADGFGPRIAPCASCSSYHEGVDFDAGYGATVHAIAAGVVVETTGSGSSALGIHVAIEHVIGGKTIVSAYGHMQAGSMKLTVGDVVYAGEPVGLVGNTGASTGAHLHFEIRQNGTTPVDPLAWMHAHLG
jgi:murein DD-endopeptidase MepM/ murein hydrolase activator NlpD